MAKMLGNKNQSGFLVRLRFTVKFQYKMAKITGNKTNRVFSHVYVFCGQGIIMGTKSCGGRVDPYPGEDGDQQ